MEIRPLTPADATAWRAIRLRMLSEHPEAFESDAGEFESVAVAEVEERIRANSGPDQVMYGAFDGADLVGTIGFFQHRGVSGPDHINPVRLAELGSQSDQRTIVIDEDHLDLRLLGIQQAVVCHHVRVPMGHDRFERSHRITRSFQTGWQRDSDRLPFGSPSFQPRVGIATDWLKLSSPLRIPSYPPQ